MSGVDDAASPASPSSTISAEALRLRAPPPRVVRLSRKVLIGLGATSAATVFGAVLFALHLRTPHAPGDNLVDNVRPNPAEAVKNAPADYAALHSEALGPLASSATGVAGGALPAGVPRLGRPLPGDLGRPILNAGAESSAPPLGGPSPLSATTETSAASGAGEKLAQERASALASPLFSGREAASGAQSLALAADPLSQALSSSGTAGVTAPSSAGASPSGQEHKLAFLTGTADAKTSTAEKVESDERLRSPSSPYVVQAGTVIPAALLTGIRSDVPGEITAQVSEDVYDSPTGHYRLIPQGARLVGQYDSQIAFGQSSVLLVWTRLILPDGRSIVLERLPGADAAGNAGLREGVNNHWGELFKAAALSSILGIGTQIGVSDNENGLIQALRQGPADTLNQVGQQMIGRSLNIQPTLTIRPGFEIRVLINRDLLLEPYGG